MKTTYKVKYPANSFVLVQYPAGLGDSHRPPDKLLTRWQGPFRVIGNNGDEYELQGLVTEKTTKHHIYSPFAAIQEQRRFLKA